MNILSGSPSTAKITYCVIELNSAGACLNMSSIFTDKIKTSLSCPTSDSNLGWEICHLN